VGNRTHRAWGTGPAVRRYRNGGGRTETRIAVRQRRGRECCARRQSPMQPAAAPACSPPGLCAGAVVCGRRRHAASAVRGGLPNTAASGVTPTKCQRRAATARHGTRAGGGLTVAPTDAPRRARRGGGVMAPPRGARPAQYKKQVLRRTLALRRLPGPVHGSCLPQTNRRGHSPPPPRRSCRHPPPTRGGGALAIRPHTRAATPIAATTPPVGASRSLQRGGHFTAKKRGPPRRSSWNELALAVSSPNPVAIPAVSVSLAAPPPPCSPVWPQRGALPLLRPAGQFEPSRFPRGPREDASRQRLVWRRRGADEGAIHTTPLPVARQLLRCATGCPPYRRRGGVQLVYASVKWMQTTNISRGCT